MYSTATDTHSPTYWFDGYLLLWYYRRVYLRGPDPPGHIDMIMVSIA